MHRYTIFTITFMMVIAHATQTIAQVVDKNLQERFQKMSTDAEEKGLAEPFKGITVDGQVEEGLFPITSTGVSTTPVRKAAENFLKALNTTQQEKTRFSVDDKEWRSWMNQHFYVRKGMGFYQMTDLKGRRPLI